MAGTSGKMAYRNSRSRAKRKRRLGGEMDLFLKKQTASRNGNIPGSQYNKSYC
jgi:hypothetical protein